LELDIIGMDKEYQTKLKNEKVETITIKEDIEILEEDIIEKKQENIVENIEKNEIK